MDAGMLLAPIAIAPDDFTLSKAGGHVVTGLRQILRAYFVPKYKSMPDDTCHWNSCVIESVHMVW